MSWRYLGVPDKLYYCASAVSINDSLTLDNSGYRRLYAIDFPWTVALGNRNAIEDVDVIGGQMQDAIGQFIETSD